MDNTDVKDIKKQVSGRPRMEDPARKILSFACTSREAEYIKSKARESGKSRSEFMRQLVLGGL